MSVTPFGYNLASYALDSQREYFFLRVLYCKSCFSLILYLYGYHYIKIDIKKKS